MAEKTGDANFCIMCTIEKLPTPLILNIFAQCVEVLPLITYLDRTDAITNILDKNNENTIHFGVVN